MIKLNSYRKEKAAYYISTSGDTNNSGLSPDVPKIFSDIASLDFSVIKNLKLKAGDTFYGSITLNYSGVTISRYGTGDNPIIDNSEDISGLSWVNDSADYWYATTDNPGWVILNDDFMKCAQTTNWLSMTACPAANQIQFDTTGIDTSNLIGGDVIIREYDWNVTKIFTITNYSAGVITLNENMYSTSTSRKFIILNRYQFLASAGSQWVYDNGKIWIRSTVDPSTLNLRKTSTESLLTLNYDNIIVQGVNFQNTYATFINFSTHNHLTVDNCSFTNSKFYGIYATLGTNNFVNVTNCKLINIGDSAINLNLTGGGKIINNIITDVGVQNNYAFPYPISESPYDTRTLSTAIRATSDYSTQPEWTIENNIISNTAWSAIISRGSNSTIKYNIIRDWHRLYTDGGAIYIVSQDSNHPNDNYEIAYNICYYNSVSGNSYWVSAGIYIDLYNTNINVHHNVIYGIADSPIGCGYFANTYPTEITFENNIIIGCTYQLYFFNSSQEVTNYVQNNQLSTRLSSQFCWGTNISDETLFFKNGGLEDYNYFFNPYLTIISKSSAGTYNFTDFKTQTGQDANSISKSNWLTYVDAATALSQVKLYINKSNVDTTIVAPSGYEDIDGNDISGQTLDVPAYYGLLILKSA